jgi:hypothetical protein
MAFACTHSASSSFFSFTECYHKKLSLLPKFYKSIPYTYITLDKTQTLMLILTVLLWLAG